MRKVTLMSYPTWKQRFPHLDKNIDEGLKYVVTVFKGRKEYVLHSEDKLLITKIKSIPSDDYLGLSMKLVKQFLEQEKIDFEIDDSKPTYL